VLKVTDNAKEELKRIAESRDLDPGKSLRLAVPPAWEGPGDFGVVIAEEGHADLEFRHNGVKVLLVDAGLAERLSSSVLDYKDAQFKLDVY
jgi:Fe-S cluster assembly iron-binding protein IscA